MFGMVIVLSNIMLEMILMGEKMFTHLITKVFIITKLFQVAH